MEEWGQAAEGASRIVVLPNFVPLPETTPAQQVRPAPEPYFLYVGRLEKLKGVQTLIPVFARYPAATLLVAGTGSLERQLRMQASSCPNIRFLGQQPPEQVYNLMQGAVALLVPSICLEVFPTVTIEAFSQRTPAIVRDIGGLTEQIDESGGGLVYRTEAELPAAMERLLRDRALRDELAEQGFQAYSRLWTPEAHLQGYFSLIQDLLARRRDGPARGSGGATVH
jgi:glycosyltransferase involved in cell wall biosynthesis